MKKVKTKLQAILNDQGRTQKWLAKQIDITEPTVSLYCTKGTKNIDTLKEIASVLDVTVFDLID